MDNMVISEPKYRKENRLYSVPTAPTACRMLSKDHPAVRVYGSNNRFCENRSKYEGVLCGQDAEVFIWLGVSS
jgi:hypothetical protein